jgi:hypothetical protein
MSVVASSAVVETERANHDCKGPPCRSEARPPATVRSRLTGHSGRLWRIAGIAVRVRMSETSKFSTGPDRQVRRAVEGKSLPACTFDQDSIFRGMTGGRRLRAPPSPFGCLHRAATSTSHDDPRENFLYVFKFASWLAQSPQSNPMVSSTSSGNETAIDRLLSPVELLPVGS